MYWEAFGPKLGRVLFPRAQALDYIARSLDPDFSLVARDGAGALLGAAGFKTAEGMFLNGSLSRLRETWGWWGGTWRGLLLSPLERDLSAGTLLMDGIFVTADARGRGIGSLLLDAIMNEAKSLGTSRVQLDVIDTNPRARALYERTGFVPERTERTGPFRLLFGFHSSTRMIREL